MIEEKNFWYETSSIDMGERLQEYLTDNIIEHKISLNGYCMGRPVYHFDVYCGDDVAQEIKRFLNDTDYIAERK